MRAWSLFALGVVVAGAGALAGCPDPPAPGTTPDPARLSIRLRLRQSCGFDIAEYDTSCLAAVQIELKKTLTGDLAGRGCAVLDTRPANLQRFLFDDEPHVSFGTLASEGEVIFEMRALHDKNLPPDAGPELLCEDEGELFENWLIFGQSAPFDLGQLQDADAGVVVVDVPIDCRDCTAGCSQLGQATCPTNPISFCVPGSANLNCEKPCEEHEDCFEGALTCDVDAGTCIQASADVGRDYFCKVCTSDEDCLPLPDDDEGFFNFGTFCVGIPGEPTGICAPRCPQNPCAVGTKCNRLGNRLRRVVPAPVDGGP